MRSNRGLFPVDNNLDNIVKTLARLYKWTPDYINSLYVDEIDEFGLMYWFEDAKDYIKQINNSGGALN